MGDKISLALDKRELYGKKVGQLRKQGLTPVIVYGPGIEPIAAQTELGAIKKVVRDAGKHTPVYVTIDGKKKIAMIKEIDVDPVKGTIRHVAFHAVKQNQPVEAEVPIRLVGEGESEAERNGLIVLQTLEKIEVKALPMDLPEALEADIRALKEPGEKLLLESVKLPENVELVDNDSGHHEQDEEEHSVTELVIASVWEPSALQAANEAAAGDAEDESEVEAENGAEEETAEAEGEASPERSDKPNAE